MNKVFLSGRPTADPEVRHTQTGKAVAAFTLAVDKGKNEADFIRIQTWEKKAEFTEKYIKKGMKIIVTGRITTGSYKDKDGKTLRTFEIIADEIEFAEKKQQSTQEDTGFVNIPIDEELPFN